MWCIFGLLFGRWPTRNPNSKQAGLVVDPWLVVWPMAYQKPQQQTGGACGASLACRLADGLPETPTPHRRGLWRIFGLPLGRWPTRNPDSEQAGRVVHPWLVAWPIAHQKPQHHTGGACGASLACRLADCPPETPTANRRDVWCILGLPFG